MVVQPDDGAAPHGPRPTLPTIIQGGMGVAVSSWRLARAVSRTGQLGVVSGTALDVVVARRLQDGDDGGHLRRALAHLPVPDVAERVLARHYRPGGRAPGRPYVPVPKVSARPSTSALELSVAANFAEVWLAKEGHDGVVGINFLEKIRMATPSAAYGAMLAGVDYVLMGAGIPTEIPRLLDALARHEPASIALHVEGASRRYSVGLDPQALTGGGLEPLRRPRFLAIISAHVLATHLAREDATRPDGFVVEGPRAGGHNAPPRGRLVLDDDGQPVFGPRDDADLARIAAVGLPFWLAGGYSSPELVARARAAGAAGVQVGSIFALSAESGLRPALREEMLAALAEDRLEVRTDPHASPTSFPFKVVSLPGTLSEPTVYEARPRLCDVSHLRVPYEREPGSLGYRCPAEPVDLYVGKGGSAEDTVGRKCLCNALLADVGLGQTRRDGYQEDSLVTLGTDLDGAAALVAAEPSGWSAARAVEYLLGRP
ncbi:nitronate monooxygenase [Georgenia muralis]|uniref:NAD(P)H-dependent flavin oxidoreductase YrpB (Nitropropane dioxygenase family) n=1 Tax=Georgenia muralis TaxID=154117 RepID=A0A3N4Z5E0_9MICO|nr:nitronate monooxygenase [Georgenia muralis]RPF27637.1 NAD(P)H-dependent flavin oxidoreductase YrpB (nitropropane dioxygenase family) [Georgenia muralis]